MPDQSQPKIFAMVASGSPLSLQSGSSKRNSAYQQWLSRIARSYFSSPHADEHFRGLNLYLRIVWFHNYPTRSPDVDNMIKPIADALEGTVYPEDRLLSQCLCERVYVPPGKNIEIVKGPAVSTKVFEALLKMIGDNHRSILYIEVGEVRYNALVIGVPIGASLTSGDIQ